MKACKQSVNEPLDITLSNGEVAIFTVSAVAKRAALTIISHNEIASGSIARLVERHRETVLAPIDFWKVIGDESTTLAQEKLSALGIHVDKIVKRAAPISMLYEPDQLRLRLKLAPLSLVSEPSSNKQIKVLVVDDSQTIRGLLEKIINSDSRLRVVASAEKPSEVEELIKSFQPDVITLDINMPEESGVSLLRRIFPKYKIPTIMISAISLQEGRQVLEALEIGAVDYIQKPSFSELQSMTSVLSEKVITAAKSKPSHYASPSMHRAASGIKLDPSGLILIGASTGGTEAIKHVLLQLPKEIPPILIVQHIPAVFSKAFADRMNQLCPFQVVEANQDDEIVKPNTVYIAAGGTQLSIVPESRSGEIRLKVDASAEPMNRHKPSVDYLFYSAARGLRRSKVAAAILTGMGADGARSLLDLKNRGYSTIAQDEKTSVVFGMPKEAIALGAAQEVLPLDQIASRMVALFATSKK
jgi:two-component system chemotaxis response regulator CheB